jgi:hypothetical protein
MVKMVKKSYYACSVNDTTCTVLVVSLPLEKLHKSMTLHALCIWC